MAGENNSPKNKISIAILDDNFAVRQTLKLLVQRIVGRVGLEPMIYSAADGVEGIGYTLVTVPNIIVIDTTLPKYSGREVVDYLSTNDKFINQQIKVLVIYDGDKQADNSKENFKYLNKQAKDFVAQLESHLLKGVVSSNGGKGKKVSEKFIGKLLQSLIGMASKVDILRRRRSSSYFLPKKFVYWVIWLINSVIVNSLLTFVLVFVAKPDEINDKQAAQDEYAIQLRVYPFTLISVIVGFFLFFQLLALLLTV